MMQKLALCLLFLAVGFQPGLAHAGATPSFEATAKMTCYMPNGTANTLAKETVSGSGLIADILDISEDTAANFHLANVDGLFLVLDRCTNGLAKVLTQPVICQTSAGTGSTDQVCSVEFQDWQDTTVTGRALCRTRLKGDALTGTWSGSCSGEIDPGVVGPCAITLKIGHVHKIPKDCPS